MYICMHVCWNVEGSCCALETQREDQLRRTEFLEQVLEEYFYSSITIYLVHTYTQYIHENIHACIHIHTYAQKSIRINTYENHYCNRYIIL